MKDQDMRRDISDETLMAFADGVLDEPMFSQVAEALENDQVLATRLVLLVTGSKLAQRGFDQLLVPVSPKLETNVLQMFKRAERKSDQRFSWPSWLVPVGAVTAAAFGFVVAIPTLGGWNASSAPSAMAELTSQEVATVLDTLASGDTTTLKSGTVVNPIATFNNSDALVCREFETQGSASYLAISCRVGPSWSVQLAIATANTDSSYRPASGIEVLDVYLQTIGAGAPLVGEEELDALRSVSR